MLIFDQLKKDDPQLRFIAGVVLSGFVLLLAGLWWVQIVSTSYYQEKLEVQSIRTVRIPAVRGSILDRNGRPLAENQPSYNINLYLEDLSKKYQTAYEQLRMRVKNDLIAKKEASLNRKLSAREKKQFAMPSKVSKQLSSWIPALRYQVTSNIVADLSRLLQEPVSLTEKDFQRSYDKARSMPLTVLSGVKPDSVRLARFSEQSIRTPGMDLDVQSLRSYPSNRLAAHLIGYVGRNSDSAEGEPASFNYRLDDYIGRSGLEAMYDRILRGKAGAKAVVVNHLGYRQQETLWSPVEPGRNLILTIDADIQRAAELALQDAPQAGVVKGAVVVMNAQNGDILAMASTPSYDLNFFVERHDPAEWNRGLDYLNDTNSRPQANRAIHENLPPGSIFKIVVGLAALELGLDPNVKIDSPGYLLLPGRDPFDDTAGAGEFDFNRAMAKSCNVYFQLAIERPGVLQRVIALGQALHLGERTGLLLPGQETPGSFPSQRTIGQGWYKGDSANFAIGQGKIAVTPVQMAVMTAAIANGGNVLWPRVVARSEALDGGDEQTFPEGRVRDTLKVKPGNLAIVRLGMLQDVTSFEGTGRGVAIPGLQIAGKTGTAQVVGRNGKIDRDLQQTWFTSFAPYDRPQYVVVATVQGGSSGGTTCVPVVQKIYLAILQAERRAAARLASTATKQ